MSTEKNGFDWYMSIDFDYLLVLLLFYLYQSIAIDDTFVNSNKVVRVNWR